MAGLPMTNAKLLIFLLCFGALCAVAPAEAAASYGSVFVTPPDSDSQTTVDDPYLKNAFFGQLTGYPHTYRINLDTAQLVTFTIAEPVSEPQVGNAAILVVKEEERGVSEVARLWPTDAAWEEEFVIRTGDTYRVGGTFREELSPGSYLIEVSNGDNLGRYVLRFGEEPRPDQLGFFGTLKEVRDTKRFLGKPFYTVLASPYYYVPTLLLLLVGVLWYRRRYA